MENHSVERRAVINFAKFFFRPVFVKKGGNFWIFSKHSKFPSAHCASQVWRSFSLKAFVRSNCFLFSGIGKLVTDRSRNFRGAKVFAGEFLQKQLKPKFSQKASVILSHFSCLIYHIWHPNAGFGMECEALVAFSFYRKLSDYSTRFWPKTFKYISELSKV